MAHETLDAGAANCGRLISLVAEAMHQLQPGDLLHVRAYDPSSQLDIAAWCRMTGHRLQSVTPAAGDAALELVIEKTANDREAQHGTRDDKQHPRQG